MLDFGINLLTDDIADDSEDMQQAEVAPRFLDIHAIVLKSNSKKRKMFDARKEGKQIENVLGGLPGTNDVFKIISGKFGFSSYAVIDFIARKEVIELLQVSTFRIGKKQMECLKKLYKKGRIVNADFLTSSLNAEDKKTGKYSYFSDVSKICDEIGWNIFVTNNHSKVILAKTEHNFYVCETSSNLNENPKIEQYSFENDERTWQFYHELFEALKDVK